MHPLRGNVLSTVHCRTGLQQRLEKTVKAYRIFFTVRFPGIFVFVCVFIWLFACLSTFNVIKMRSN